jgi:hypothetical protein
MVYRQTMSNATNAGKASAREGSLSPRLRKLARGIEREALERIGVLIYRAEQVVRGLNLQPGPTDERLWEAQLALDQALDELDKLWEVLT